MSPAHFTILKNREPSVTKGQVPTRFPSRQVMLVPGVLHFRLQAVLGLPFFLPHIYGMSISGRSDKVSQDSTEGFNRVRMAFSHFALNVFCSHRIHKFQKSWTSNFSLSLHGRGIEMLFYAGWFLLLLNTEYLDMKRRWDISLDVILANKDISVFPFHKPRMPRVKVTSIASRQFRCPSLPDKKTFPRMSVNLWPVPIWKLFEKAVQEHKIDFCSVLYIVVL